MILQKLIERCTPLEVKGRTDIELTALEIDSRRVTESAGFIAMRGTQVDGHTFIAKAVALGAKAVFCETLPETLAEDVTYVRYASTEDVAGDLATCFFGDPTQRMKLIGVTGTNGKTTIATTLYNVMRQMGHKSGLCSTV